MNVKSLSGGCRIYQVSPKKWEMRWFKDKTTSGLQKMAGTSQRELIARAKGFGFRFYLDGPASDAKEVSL